MKYSGSLVPQTTEPNEGINQKYLKNWADVADKICFGRTSKNLGLGLNFRPCREGYFLSGRP